MHVRVSAPADRKEMRLRLLCALFKYIFVFALSAFIMVSNIAASEGMAMDMEFCPVNSSLISTCVKITSNPPKCTAVNGPGILCANRNLNPSLCDGCPEWVVKQSTHNLDKLIDENEPIKYPLPASTNVLYLVGYSKELNTSRYSCVASRFLKFGGGFIHRTLILRPADSEGKPDEIIPIMVQAKLCYITMNLSVNPDLIEKAGAKSQYLLFHQTWNTMLLTELVDKIQEPLLCSLWAKYKNAREHLMDTITLDLFNAVCKEPVYDGYPEECPKYDT
ncbi:japanin-like-RA2 isoform X1 [Rhipicephalus microplus]|uniref:japanin-like-RA2 isoform X1 n=1 Tax=Rhipicephalus microplus TaxID=6941 RepID=UPI003F6A929D